MDCTSLDTLSIRLETARRLCLPSERLPTTWLSLMCNLPGIDGFEVLRRVREGPDPGPAVLFLTARDAIEDRVAGLDLGAEDYLVKPFAFAELLARIRSLFAAGPAGDRRFSGWPMSSLIRRRVPRAAATRSSSSPRRSMRCWNI